MSKNYTGERFLPEECQGEMAAEHYQRYQFAARLVHGKDVLDAACGEGYGSSLLSREARSVTGLDLDGAAVERAREKYGSESLSFREGSIRSLPFPDGSFDVVVSYETIEHVDGEIQADFLGEIRRVLRAGGLLIMSTPNKAVYTDRVKGENPYHVKEFYVQEYETFLRGYFKNVELLCQYPHVGYFISRPGETPEFSEKPPRVPEESRYVIALCTDREERVEADTNGLTIYEDSMYYDLNRTAHEQEQQLRNLKSEADAFQNQLQGDIRELKRYISKLRKDNAILMKRHSSIFSRIHVILRQADRYLSERKKKK